MKKLLTLSLILLYLFAGCSNNTALPLENEPINTFDVSPAQSESPIDSPLVSNNPSASILPSSSTIPSPGPTSSISPSQSPSISNPATVSLEEKFNSIKFYIIAGNYSRIVTLDNQQTTEMFSFDKTNFIRITSNDFEQEIFAYNYISDNFTYLYYFDNEMLSKTIFNIDTGAILEDRDGYSELLKSKADELKTYFYSLIESANITVDEID